MTDTGDTGTSLANTIRGLKKFNGSNPADFKAWMKTFCVVIGVTRRDILPRLKGEEKPTDTAKTAGYNRANEDLYAMLYLLVELPAALCVQKYEDESEISGDGQAAFKELCGNYDKVTDEVICATMEELVNTPMESGQNPDDYFNKERLLRIRIENMGEKVYDRWFKDICVTSVTDEYKDVKMMMYRNSSFDIDQMQTTERHMFLDQQSRNGMKGRIAGRGTAMTTKTSTDHDVYCFKCKERGHTKRNCRKFKPRTNPDRTSMWCSVHRTTSHSDEGCYSQGATRSNKKASVSLACASCAHRSSGNNKSTADTTAVAKDNESPDSEKPVINFAGSNNDFDGLHVYSSSHETIHPQHQGCNATGRQWCVGIIPRRQTDPRAEGKDAGVYGAFNAERDHNRRETHNLWSRHRHHLVHHPRQPRCPTFGQPPRADCTRPRTQHLHPNSRTEERSADSCWRSVTRI